VTKVGLIDELKAVRDSVEELYLLLDHIWRNRQELHDILEAEDRLESAQGGEHVPETIACAWCDVDSPDSLAAALEEGWIDLCCDDGAGWNYLGVCPECQAKDRGEAVEQPHEQKQLFA
jgi:hypothetical protein